MKSSKSKRPEFDPEACCGVIKSGNAKTYGLYIGNEPPRERDEWYYYAIPTYNQKYPSCVGHATANWIEIMIRRYVSWNYFSDGQQIDGDAIWRRARDMFWDGTYDGGIHIDQGFLAAKDLGILPPGSKLRHVRGDLFTMSHQLITTPMLQGTFVTHAWRKPDSNNGYIEVDMPGLLGGHATCIIGLTQQDANWYVVFQNSWGSDWGRYGYGMLLASHWFQCLIEDPVTVSLPDGWEAWRGWDDYLISL